MKAVTDKYIDVLKKASWDADNKVIDVKDATKVLEEFEIALLKEWEQEKNNEYE